MPTNTRPWVLNIIFTLKRASDALRFHEDLSLVERDRAAAYFAEESGGAQALICSEIGSEGRNFQFAKHLICFDLPKHPDLLEQRIGRLDRIGQGSDIYLHLPILEHTAQAVVYRWLDEGLNAFNATCSVGHQLYSEFADALAAAMQDGSGLEDLIEATRQRRQDLLQESEKGRDRLLERNSHNTERGAAIITALEQRESAATLHAFCEMLFDRIGIDQDYLDEQLTVIKPTENLVTGQLPGLDENGATATYDRNTALSRDDVIFLTWEHPIVMESMATLLSSDIGKASIGTFKHRGVPAGTVLLEALYRVECLAPEIFRDGTIYRSNTLANAADRGRQRSRRSTLIVIPRGAPAKRSDSNQRCGAQQTPPNPRIAIPRAGCSCGQNGHRATRTGGYARSANAQCGMGSVAVSAIRQPRDPRRRGAGHGTAS